MSGQVSEIDIEQKLDTTFKPIEPDPEFVRKLGHRLVWQPESIVIEEIQPRSIGLLAGFLLLTVIACVIWLIKRAD